MFARTAVRYVRTNLREKFLRRFFQKATAVEARSLLALRRGRNTLIGISFLITFFFVPLVSKKKVANNAEYINGYNHYGKGNPPLVRFPRR